MYVSRDQKDWDKHLTSVLFGYRVSPHDTTGESPFYLLYGREPRLPVDVSLLPSSNESRSVNEHRARIVQTLEEAQNIARTNIQRAQQNMKNIYDRTARDPEFTIGDKVWVFTPKTKKGLSRKLMHHWHGPFRIVAKCSPVHFKLRTCDNRLVSITVHANRMKRYYHPESRPQNPPINDFANDNHIPEEELPDDSFVQPHPTPHPNPSPERDKSHTLEPCTSQAPTGHDTTDIVYKIEHILKERKRKGKKQFFVKWEGYGQEHNSWVDETDMIHTET